MSQPCGCDDPPPKNGKYSLLVSAKTSAVRAQLFREDVGLHTPENLHE